MFTKPALTIEQQIEQLKQRGLTIEPADEAEHFLVNIGYYRLAGYWWPMQADKEKHIFKPDSKFKDVIFLYNFDRELRLILFDVIEKIEISLRSKLVYSLSHEFDPWWFQNFELFHDSKELVKTLASIEEEIDRSKDVFIKDHKRRHNDDGRYPPSWKTLEITSFGSLSKLYGNLKPAVRSKDTIAADFGAVNHTYLPSWLQCISQIRNYCAHHSRLWNRNLPGRPKLLSKPPQDWISDVPSEGEFQYLYIHLCLMKYLLNTVQPVNHFTPRLANLFDKYPSVDPKALGIKASWEKEPLWKYKL